MFRGEEKNPVNLLIFCLICGLYTLYWLYQTVEDVNKALNREEFNPMIVLVSSLLCFPLSIFWGYKLTQVLPEIQQQRGLPPAENATIILILFVFFPPLAVYMYQTELNKIWAATT